MILLYLRVDRLHCISSLFQLIKDFWVFSFSYGAYWYCECALMAESIFGLNQSVGRLIYFLSGIWGRVNWYQSRSLAIGGTTALPWLYHHHSSSTTHHNHPIVIPTTWSLKPLTSDHLNSEPHRNPTPHFSQILFTDIQIPKFSSNPNP